jgi:hypothetical protein
MEVSDLLHAPAPLCPRKAFGIHWTGGSKEMSNAELKRTHFENMRTHIYSLVDK